MKYIKFFLYITTAFFLFYFIAPPHVYAYLDAGSGSYMIQILIAIFIGGALGIKVFWRRIYAFFSKPSTRGKKGDQSPKQ